MNLFQSLTALQYITGIIVLIFLLFINAPYGKHSRAGWGPKVNSRFAWMFMELPAVSTLAIMFLFIGNFSITNIFLFVLWEIHYIYRTFIFTALQRGSKKTFPLILVISAFLFNINNGIINGQGVFPGNMSIALLLNFTSLSGFILFITGFIMHVHSDWIIRSLRKDNVSGYQIPMKGLFKYISNPNYLGEIVEWTGWAILTGSLAGWAFAFFTFCNLFPRAIANHKWYQENFAEYPKDRKIIFPFIF